MAKAINLNKSGARVLKAKAPATPDYASIGRQLADGALGLSKTIAGIRADADAAIGRAKSGVFNFLQELATQVPGLTFETFKAEIEPAFLEAAGLERLNGNLSGYRNALIGFANGIECPEDCAGNAQKYGAHAKRTLDAKGASKPSKAGRKAGSASASQDAAKEAKTIKSLSVDGRIAAFASIFPGDKKTMANRIAWLAAIVEGDADAKLLDKVLRDLAAKFE